MSYTGTATKRKTRGRNRNRDFFVGSFRNLRPCLNQYLQQRYHAVPDSQSSSGSDPPLLVDLVPLFKTIVVRSLLVEPVEARDEMTCGPTARSGSTYIRLGSSRTVSFRWDDGGGGCQGREVRPVIPNLRSDWSPMGSIQIE